MQTKYAATIFQYDPLTETDYIYTRQEMISSSLSEAYANQELMCKHLEPGASYRSFIQKRHYVGKYFNIDHIENIIEVTL